MKQLELVISTSNTRGGNLRLVQQRLHNRITAALFFNIIPSVWNRLPANLITEKTLTGFKRKLHSFLMAK